MNAKVHDYFKARRPYVDPTPAIAPRGPNKMSLLWAFGSGAEVTLWHRKESRFVVGTITGICLESGFTPPAQPRHFIVTVREAQGPRKGREVEVYVKAE